MTVLLILLVLLFLLLITPVGVCVSYRRDLLVRVRFGFLRLTVYPPKKKDKTKIKKKSKGSAAKPKMAKPTWEQIRFSLDMLLPALGKALQRTRRRVRIDPLEAEVVFGGEDPADVAILYSKVQALVSALLPMMEQLVSVKNRRVSLMTDYEAERTVFTAEVGVRILVWDILVIGFGLLGTGIKWLRGYRELKKTAEAERAARTDDTTNPTGAAGDA